MNPTTNPVQPSALELLQSLPGIGDVVWATITRLASSRVTTNVLLTAAERDAGTTVLAAATAIGLAQHQRVPVCLIETNVRRPALARYLGLQGKGLSDILDGRAELEECLQPLPQCPSLNVLPAGSARLPLSGEFTTERMRSILRSLEGRCRFLVLDTAPLLDHVESRLLLDHADGVLLVLRAHATRLSDAERAYEILVESGAPVLGSIFNANTGSARFGGNGRMRHPFEKDARAGRLAAPALPPALLESAHGNGNGQPAPEREQRIAAGNGAAPHTNGIHDIEAHVPDEAHSEAAHQHQIAQLERRIAKLTLLLEQTEANLQRIAAQKDVDPGIASLEHGVPGLAAEDEARAFKLALMHNIFQANLELKTAMARRR
jgi:Mrp family chromosome partitioning ATPase